MEYLGADAVLTRILAFVVHGLGKPCCLPVRCGLLLLVVVIFVEEQVEAFDSMGGNPFGTFTCYGLRL